MTLALKSTYYRAVVLVTSPPGKDGDWRSTWRAESPWFPTRHQALEYSVDRKRLGLRGAKAFTYLIRANVKPGKREFLR